MLSYALLCKVFCYPIRKQDTGLTRKEFSLSNRRYLDEYERGNKVVHTTRIEIEQSF